MEFRLTRFYSKSPRVIFDASAFFGKNVVRLHFKLYICLYNDGKIILPSLKRLPSFIQLGYFMLKLQFLAFFVNQILATR